MAWQILALNTEKAHNLKDKSLEVIRIFRNLMEESTDKPEKIFGYYFEGAAFIKRAFATSEILVSAVAFTTLSCGG